MKTIIGHDIYRYLGKENMNAMKGIAAIMVLTHHIYLYSGILTDSVFRVIPQSFGSLAVAVFFFVTGYGHACKMGKRMSVRQAFFGILSRYLPILILLPLYLGIRLLIGETVSGGNVAKALVVNTWLIEFGWYFYVSLYFCILFSVSHLLFKGNEAAVTLFCACGVLAYYAYGLLTNASSMVFECAPVLLLGMCWQRGAKWITKRVLRHPIWILAGCGLAFALCMGLSYYVSNWQISIALKTLSAMAFAALFLIATIWINICNPVFLWLGDRSLEIYGLQGAVLLLLTFYLTNRSVVLFIILAYLLTILLAAVVYPGRRKLFSLLK